MNIICPAITAVNTHQYREQVERIQDFSKVIHIDVMDGHFTKSESPGIAQLWWPKNIKANLHLMVESPLELIDHAIKLNPEMIIVHAEASMTQVMEVLLKLKHIGIKSGLALLPESSPNDDDIYGLLSMADHALIFGGNLGFQGGEADMSNLSKIKTIKENFPNISIGWDGGINKENITKIKDFGVEIFNVGSYIQKSRSPKDAYSMLNNQII